MTKYKYGFKFLDPRQATEYNGIRTYYSVPRDDRAWSDWFVHPDATINDDGQDCGPGGWHVMNSLSASYAPQNWTAYFVRYEAGDIIGASDEKTRVRKLQIRNIPERVLWRWLRLGLGTGANLRRAELTGANLTGANLTGANLTGANLRCANLTGANLTGADLWCADLWCANLRRANLRRAELTGANLTGANLTGAILPEGYKVQS